MTLRAQRWVIGIALVLVLASLRLPWIEADVGSRGIWPFGAFSSDEGEYTGGGRLSFLSRRWLDSEMGYPSTLTYAPGMHLLSAASYQVLGLTQAAARAPTACAAVIAWLLAYLMASRATSPWLAGAVTLVISSNPISLTYERWGSSDVVFAAEIVVAWWLLRRNRPWRGATAGLAAGLAVLTKSTAILFVPFLFALILTRAPRRTAAASCFAAALAATFTAGQLWVLACVNSDAQGALSPVEFPATQTMLSFHAEAILRALAVFPRASTTMLLGPFAFWLFLLPVWYLALSARRPGRLFTPRMVTCAALAFYVAALATQVRNPSRYFLPLFYFTPLLLVYGRQMLFRAPPRDRRFNAALLAASLLIAFLYWSSFAFPSSKGIEYVLSNAYILPHKLAWAVTWPVVLSVVALLASVAVMRLGWRGGIRQGFLVVALSVGTGCIFTSGFGYAALGSSRGYIVSQLLLQLAVVAAFSIILAGRQQIRWPYWYGFAAQLFVAAAVFNPCWRNAYPTLLTREYSVRNSAAHLATRLPPDAVVVGRRASTLLQNTRMRVGLFTLCSLGKEGAPEVVERLSRLMKSAPRGEVYWIIAADEINFYVSPEQKEIRTPFRVELVDAVLVPGDRNPTPVLLFLVRLQPRHEGTPIPG